MQKSTATIYCVVNNITLTKIENMKKVLKSDCAALDFDKNFIINSINADDFNFEEIEFGVKRVEARKERGGVCFLPVSFLIKIFIVTRTSREG
jgi:hypothetical protein